MKYRTTNKAINSGYCNVIRLGYCTFQSAFPYLRETAYTCGVYGWNADVYEMPECGTTCLCIGYRPTGNIVPPHYLIKEAEDKLSEMDGMPYEIRRGYALKVMDEFIRKAIEYHKGR